MSASFDYSCETEAWREFIAKMHSGQPVPITEEMMSYWLEVLPPAYYSRRVTLPSAEVVLASFGFAEGHDQITAFYKQNGRWFCCRTNDWHHG